MPYTLKDFQPFFKSIDGPVEFYPNDRITASKIVFYDGSILEGNVTVFINNAKITKKRRRLIYSNRGNFDLPGNNKLITMFTDLS